MKKQDEDASVNLDGLSETSKRAVRSHLLEGIVPDAALLEDLRQLDSGVITLEELKAQGVARILKTTAIAQSVVPKVITG